MKQIQTFIFLVLISINLLAQEERIQTSNFLYWQIGTIIEFSDFQKEDIDPKGLELMEKYSLHSLANVQIHCILDYPKKAKKIKELPEEWYIAPVFCKQCSPLIANDSIELEIAQIYFDIAEYCARLTRKRLRDLESQNHGHGIIAAIFPRQIDEMYKLMREMFSSFGNSLYDNKVDAINEWRPVVNEMLEKTKEYSTSKNECIRFIQDKPSTEEYKTVYSKLGQNV